MNSTMPWTEYALAMLLFSGVSMLLLYVIERIQQALPSKSAGLGAVDRSRLQHRGFVYHQHELAGYVPELR